MAAAAARMVGTAIVEKILSDPDVQKYGKKVGGQLADKATYGLTQGVGGLLGGKKGRRAGKKVGNFLSKARHKILGFKKGGMVKRKVIMRKK
jgi:hypothetical protein